jgi:hypothetical protein
MFVYIHTCNARFPSSNPHTLPPHAYLAFIISCAFAVIIGCMLALQVPPQPISIQDTTPPTCCRVTRLQLYCAMRRMTLLEWLGARGVRSLGAWMNMQVWPRDWVAARVFDGLAGAAGIEIKA